MMGDILSPYHCEITIINRKISSEEKKISFKMRYYVCRIFVDSCLSFFFWPLRCLFFFDFRIIITPLVSSNSFKGNDFAYILEKPSAPTIFYVVCRTTSAVALWRSEFKGGSKQEFYVQYWRISQPLPSMISPSIPDDRLTSD